MKYVRDEIEQNKPGKFTNLFINDFTFSAVSVALSVFGIFISIMIHLFARRFLRIKVSEDSQSLQRNLTEVRVTLVFFTVFLFIILFANAIIAFYSTSVGIRRTHIGIITCVAISSMFVILIFALTLT